MTDLTLKKRIETLESQIADLQFAVKALLDPKKDWRVAVAKYAGDPDLLALFADARKLREADREKGSSAREAAGKRMMLLDSDHVSVLFDLRHSLRPALTARLNAVDTEIQLPIIAVEEHLRAWLAAIRRAGDPRAQIIPYRQLGKFLDFVGSWSIGGWDENAVGQFGQLRKLATRIGTQDLKIAAIALANNATLLSANPVDFRQVPRLRVEDWLYG